MPDFWKQWLRRPRWDVGAVVALIIFCAFLLRDACSPREQVISAVVKLAFVLVDGEVLSPRQYATNAVGWSVFRTEASLLSSALMVRRAQERLDSKLKASETSPQRTDGIRGKEDAGMALPEWTFVPDGVCITASAKDTALTVNLLNEIFEVYQDERNRLFPAPPGCKGVEATLVRKAYLPSRFWNLASIIPCALSACLLGLAAAIFRSRKPAGAYLDVASLFLAWLSLLFGIAIRISAFDMAVALAGAILWASLIAGGEGCIVLAASRKFPVPPKLLRIIYVSACVLCLGYGVLEKFISPNLLWDSARVKVEIVDSTGSRQLSAGYDQRFIETECELIQSRTITGRVVEELELREALSSYHGLQLTQLEANEILNQRILAKPVKGTSLIDIHYRDVPAHGAGRVAMALAEAYQYYWKGRLQTNSGIRAAVTVLGSCQSFKRENQIKRAHDGWMLTDQLLHALFVLGGALCVAWLGRRPRLVWLIPPMLLAYLVAWGALSIMSSLRPEVYAAVCQVRIWPPRTEAPQTQTRDSNDSADPLIERERRTAGSDEVLSRVVHALDRNAIFEKGQGENWKQLKTPEKLVWLREHLNILPVQDAFLLRFVASADNREHAVEIANLAATTYCESKTLPVEKTGLIHENLLVEIMDRAVPPKWPKTSSSPFMHGLAAGSDYTALAGIGAVIGYIGFLVQRAQKTQEGRVRTNGGRG